LTHGLRIRCSFETNMPDHEWTVTGILVMHRNIVNVKDDGCF